MGSVALSPMRNKLRHILSGLELGRRKHLRQRLLDKHVLEVLRLVEVCVLLDSFILLLSFNLSSEDQNIGIPDSFGWPLAFRFSLRSWTWRDGLLGA